MVNFPSPVYKSAFNRQIQRCAMIAGINDTIYINVTKGGKVEQESNTQMEIGIKPYCPKKFCYKISIKRAITALW